jgi:hypothetical protein
MGYIVPIFDLTNFCHEKHATLKGKSAINISTFEWGPVEEIIIENCPCSYSLISGMTCDISPNIIDSNSVVFLTNKSEFGHLLCGRNNQISLRENIVISDVAVGDINKHLTDEVNNKTLNFSKLDDTWILFDANLSQSVISELKIRVKKYNVFQEINGIGGWMFSF